MLPGFPKIFDRYDLCARVAPGMFVVGPLLAVAASRFPGLVPDTLPRAGLLGVALILVLWIASMFARSGGHRVEACMKERLGGLPTELLLRHADDRLDPITKARYRASLQKLAPDVAMPTAAEEAANPKAALAAYRSAVRRLIEHRRGQGEELVLAENITYGAWRNLRGLRGPAATMGCAAALITLLPLLEVAWRDQAITWGHTGATDVLVALVLLAVGILPTVMATRNRVEGTAFRYAERLLSTLDRPTSIEPRKTRSKKAAHNGRAS